MNHRLLIRIDAAGAVRDWCISDERGASPGAQRGVPAPSVLAAARDIIVLAPQEAFLVADVTLAAKSREQLARALPFALEDLLIDSVEALHFASARGEGDHHAAAAVRRDQLAAWIAKLAEQGIAPDALLPDALALPPSDDDIALLVDGTRCLLAFADGRALAVPHDDVGLLFSHLTVPTDAEGAIRVRRYCSPVKPPIAGCVIDDDSAYSHPLLALSAGLAETVWPNLLIGAFAPRHRGAGAQRWWKIAAVLAVLGLVTAFAALAGERWLLTRRLTAVRTEMTRVFQTAFPDQTKIVDPAAQMHGEYNKRTAEGAADDALALAARVAPILGSNPQNTIRAMEFRNGALEITVLANEVSAIDRMREAAAAIPGLTAEVASANTSERGVEGRLRIAERGK